MKHISAVICELNPLHDGHRRVFSKARENSDVVIAIMSGNFVQRGECAVYDKYKRAKSAVEAGADLVFELPFPFSASSAEFFAAAAVAIAEGVGATDLYFGSECADIDALRAAAGVLDSDFDFGAGRAAVQREERLKQCNGLPQSVLSSPNDILAVEYCRRAEILLHPVKRISTDSASEIRRRIFAGRTDTAAVYPEALRNMEFIYFRSHRDGTVYAEGGGGVAGRLYNAADKTNSSEKWLALAATKQYTNARFRRAALFALCGVSDPDVRSKPLYTVLLAADSTGRAYLKDRSGSFSIFVLTNPAEKKHLTDEGMAQIELRDFADTVYSLCANMDDPYCFARSTPIIL